MDPVVFPDRIDAVVAAEIGASDRQMIDLNVLGEVEDEVELRTVDKNQVVEAGVDWRDDPDQAWSLSTESCSASRNSLG